MNNRNNVQPGQFYERIHLNIVDGMQDLRLINNNGTYYYVKIFILISNSIDAPRE